MKQLMVKFCSVVLTVLIWLSVATVWVATAQGKSSEKASPTNRILSINETADRLRNLSHWEIDNSFILEQVSRNLHNDKYRDLILKMRLESEDNLHKLRDLIHEYGREAPEYTRDFKGFFMNGYTAVRGWVSDQSVLKALQTNMNLVNTAFKQARQLNFPAKAKDIIQEICESKDRQAAELKDLL